jgi:RNA polymerase sigma-70 factor, ECF subfamily
LSTVLRFASDLGPALERLYKLAGAPADWGLGLAAFREALERSAASRFRGTPGQPARRDILAYLESLNLPDLALACACGAGNSQAWEEFVSRYRNELYRAGRAIAGDSGGRELADSLYAELYGLESREGKRRTLFDYFHGRSKLGTWLRAILSQRYINEIRRTRRTESLDAPVSDDDPRPVIDPVAPVGETADPERRRYLALLQAVLAEALAALEPRERLRLAYYYIEDLTLAQIGRLLGEHEATVSRKLDRARRDLHQQVDAALRGKKRLSEAQVQLCYEYAREEWPFDLTRALSKKE